MDELARPATMEDLKALVRSLNEQGVDYLLIGGYALFAHGYQRATTDIDLLLPASVEAGEKIKRALMVLPEQAIKELDPQWFLEAETIRVGDEIVVDLMFNAAGQTFEMLSEFREIIEVDGIPIKTVSLAGLLLTKQTMRDKDAQDRRILERAIQYLQNHGDDKVVGKP